MKFQSPLLASLAVAVLLAALPPVALAQQVAGATFDVACRLPQATRAQRIASVQARLRKLEQDRAQAKEAMQLFESASSDMKTAYRVSDACDAVATVASVVTIAGLGRKFLAKQAFSIFGHLMSRGGLLTMSGTRAATVSLGVYALFKDKQIASKSVRVKIHGQELEATSIDQLLDLQFRNASSHGPLFGPAANFLSSPVCTAKSCPMYQPELAALYDTLGEWFEQAEARARELESFQPEAWTHHFGQTIEHLSLPLARNVLKILNAETQYYRLMLQGLARDQAACAQN